MDIIDIISIIIIFFCILLSTQSLSIYDIVASDIVINTGKRYINTYPLQSNNTLVEAYSDDKTVTIDTQKFDKKADIARWVPLVKINSTRFM